MPSCGTHPAASLVSLGRWGGRFLKRRVGAGQQLLQGQQACALEEMWAKHKAIQAKVEKTEDPASQRPPTGKFQSGCSIIFPKCMVRYETETISHTPSSSTVNWNQFQALDGRWCEEGLVSLPHPENQTRSTTQTSGHWWSRGKLQLHVLMEGMSLPRQT